MTKFNVLSIDYYKEFECIGNKCEDNCCKEWKITIDKKTYNKYKKLRQKLCWFLSKLFILDVR